MKQATFGLAALAVALALVPTGAARAEEEREQMLRRILERVERLEVRMKELEKHRPPAGGPPPAGEIAERLHHGLGVLLDRARHGDRGAAAQLRKIRRAIDDALPESDEIRVQRRVHEQRRAEMERIRELHRRSAELDEHRARIAEIEATIQRLEAELHAARAELERSRRER